MSNLIAIVLLAAAVFLGACKDRVGSDGPMPQATKAPPTGFSVDTGAPPTPEQSPVTKGWSDAKLKLLKTKLPKIKNSSVLVALARLDHSELAHMTICVRQPVATAVAEMSSGFVASRWSKLDFPTLQHKDKRKIFNAENAPFRVTALLSPGQGKGCDKKNKQTKAYLTFRLLDPEKKLETKNQADKTSGKKTLDKTSDKTQPDKKSNKNPSSTASNDGGLGPVKYSTKKSYRSINALRGPTQKKPRDGGIVGRSPPRTK